MIKTKSSSAIKGFSFTQNGNEGKGLLKVQFNNGVNYVYENVPEKLFKTLKACDSTGHAVVKHIKGKYKCYKEL